jgi:hypothetical protein
MQVLDDKERDDAKCQIPNRIQRTDRIRQPHNRIITNTTPIVLTRHVMLPYPKCLNGPAHEHANEEICEAEDGRANGHNADDPYVPAVYGDAVEEDTNG